MSQHPAWVAVRAVACGLWDQPHVQGSALGLSELCTVDFYFLGTKE